MDETIVTRSFDFGWIMVARIHEILIPITIEVVHEGLTIANG